MSDRDDLADLLSDQRDKYPRRADDMDSAELADALWSAGWRKKPSAERIAEVIGRYCSGGLTLVAADAVLALLEGPTETGASNE